MSEQDDLRIIGVALIEPGLRSYQVLNNLDAGVYPVMITLSHPADAFDAKFLRESFGIVVADDDARRALIPNTSIDAVKLNIAGWQGAVTHASKQAAHAREVALAEDRRRQEVAAELHETVKALDHTERPVPWS